MENILPILIADAPEALMELCGVNLLERLLRILQRLGFRRAIVFSFVGARKSNCPSCLGRKWTPNCPTAFGTKPVGALLNSTGKYLL